MSNCGTWPPNEPELLSRGRALLRWRLPQMARLWDVATGQERITLKGHPATVTLVAVTPDGHTLVTASMDGTVKHWRAATDEEARAPRTELDPNDPTSPVALNVAADVLS